MVEQNIEVDENDNVIGVRPRDDFYIGKYIHRASALILFNSKNEILIQKRAPTKKWHPNRYTYSVSGTVAENETYESCIKKEMKEEIGISIPVKFLFKAFHGGSRDKVFYAVYIGKSDDKIRFEENEITKIEWVPADKLRKDIEKNPEKYTPTLVEGMKKYFAEFYRAEK